MRALSLFLIALLLPVIGAHHPGKPSEADIRIEAALAADWAAANRTAFAHIQAHNYRMAAETLEPAIGWIRSHPPNRLAVKSLIYMGNALMYRFRYREALEHYLLGRSQAAAIGDHESEGVLSYNISALYFQANAFELSRRAAEQALSAFQASGSRRFRAHLLVHSARLNARQGEWEGAKALYREAMWEADLEGNTQLSTTVLEVLGTEHLKRGLLAEAENALVEAFRRRKMAGGGGISGSYQNLGLLRLAQGQPKAALRLINAAMEEPGSGDPRYPAWSTYYCRAKVLAALNRLPEALDDLRKAIGLIEAYRLHMAPADAMRIRGEVPLRDVYSAYISVAADLHERTPDPELVTGSLAAAETGRALAMRSAASDASRLPEDYAETLGRLRDAYAAVYHSDSAGARAAVERIRLRLTEMELSAGLPAGDTLAWKDPRASLSAGEALLVFHQGERSLFRWSVTREYTELHRLPRVDALASGFAAEARLDGPALAGAGTSLYSALFGGLAPAVLDKPRWLLVAGGALIEVPFSALVAGRGPQGPVYLAERRSLHLLPGTWAIDRASASGAAWSGPVLAVADPIYNAADPRRRPKSWLASFGFTSGEPFQLASLPGSRREIEACRRVWDSASARSPLLLAGENATTARIEQALQAQPSVLHLATHIVPAPDDASLSLLALGLNPSGEPELAGPEWVAARDIRLRLVMMTGCRSGAGEVVPAEGLMGLTRAWLLAGARAVVATRWPMPDDGALAEAFYRHWMAPASAPVPPADALQAAQIQMIRSASFRSRPSYWASYFVLGRT